MRTGAGTDRPGGAEARNTRGLSAIVPGASGTYNRMEGSGFPGAVSARVQGIRDGKRIGGGEAGNGGRGGEAGGTYRTVHPSAFISS